MRPLWPLGRRYLFEVFLAANAVEGALEVVLSDDGAHAPRSSVWFAAPAVALLVATLMARRRFRFAAPAVLWIAAPALSFIDGRLVGFTFGAYVSGMAAAFLLGSSDDVVQARLGLVIVVIGAAIVAGNDPNQGAASLITIPALFGIAWLAGYAFRTRSRQVEAAEERAAAADAARATAARLAVAEERARIGRELHDIVGHAVTVMVLQAGAVRHKLPPELQSQRDALQNVERTGRAAMAELRSLVGAIGSGAGPEVGLGPQPSLAQLDALCDEVRRAGLAVRTRVRGPVVPLLQAIELSAYRIVQEGLTNALKHAGASQAEVDVCYRPDALVLRVRDDGQGNHDAAGNGRGLLGVRERVALYGGTMTAGNRPDGGFELRASLPIAAGGP